MNFFKKKFFLKFCTIFALVIVVFISLNHTIQRVRFAPKPLVNHRQENDFKNESRNKSIFCFILTNKENFDKRMRNIYETWAFKCDNYKFVSEIPAHIKIKSKILTQHLVKYREMNVLHPPGLLIDNYDKLTDKVFRTIEYLHQNNNDYDWYLKADDDTFVFIDNLRKFIQNKNKSAPVTYGYDFKVLVEHGYHSGGGGYLLSNEALNRLGSRLSKNYSYCSNSGTEGKTSI